MSDIGDARMPCEHGEFNKHNYTTHYGGGVTTGGFCDGGRPLHVDDFNVEAATNLLFALHSEYEDDRAMCEDDTVAILYHALRGDL